jgi:hypothetical protein
MMIRSNRLILLLCALVLPIQLFAYLDPGTGSMLFSIILGIVATSFFILKSLIYHQEGYLFRKSYLPDNKDLIILIALFYDA